MSPKRLACGLGDVCYCNVTGEPEQVVCVHEAMQGVRQRGWEAIKCRAIWKVVEGEVRLITIIAGK